MAYVTVGQQWSRITTPRRHVQLVAAQAKSIPVKPSAPGTAGGGAYTAAVAGVAVSLEPAAVAPCVVLVSQHSNARIEKSNRRTRFGEPLATTDCEDDDDLCRALPADIQSVEMEDLELEIVGRKTYRKPKKATRRGAKRLDSMASPKVQTRGVTPDRKPLVRSDGPNSARIKPRAAGIKVKSAMASKVRVPSDGDKFLTRKAWEEQAYQIIRQQKLRDAALVVTKARITVQPPMGPVETPTTAPLVSSIGNACLRHSTPLIVDGADMGDVFSSVSKQVGLEDKCRPLVEYLHTLGVRERDFVRIADKHRACLQANVNVVKERVEFLLSVGVKVQHLPKLIVRHPQIVEYRVEQAMKPRVLYLKSLGVEELKIGKIITASPSLLECSLERSIKPRVLYLVNTMGIKAEDIGKIVMRSPQILTQSIEDSLEPRLDYFLNEVKLSKDALAKMVTRHPQLLHYSIEDGVRPRVNYLRSIGMSNADVIKVLTRLTQILSLSIENCLQPKYNYLIKELMGGVHTVTSFPAYFSLSLDQRIVPRHRYLQLLGRTSEGPFPMRLLIISDIAFCEWAKSSVEAYDKFRHDLLLSTFAKEFEWKNKVRV